MPDTGAWPVVFSAGAMRRPVGHLHCLLCGDCSEGLSPLRGQEGGCRLACRHHCGRSPERDERHAHPFDAEGTRPGARMWWRMACCHPSSMTGAPPPWRGRRPPECQQGILCRTGDDSPLYLLRCRRRLHRGGGAAPERPIRASISTLWAVCTPGPMPSPATSPPECGLPHRKRQKTAPVKSFTVAGNFFELLKQITAAADNVKVPSCRRHHQLCAPSVLVEGLHVAVNDGYIVLYYVSDRKQQRFLIRNRQEARPPGFKPGGLCFILVDFTWHLASRASHFSST